ATASGVSAVELGVAGRSTTPGFEAASLLQDADRRGEIQRALADHGIVISALNATANPLHPDPEMRAHYMEAVRSAICLAAELGVTRVVTGAGCPGESEHSRRPAWVVFSESYRDVLDWQWNEVAAPIWKDLGAYAADHGVRICIEVLPG